MSNPNRTLDHRILPPFNNKRGIKYNYINNNRGFTNGVYRSSYNMSNGYNTLSEESITQYLLQNPDFLEIFLIQNYSSKALQLIISKIPHQDKDTGIAPLRSEMYIHKFIPNIDQKTEVNPLTKEAENDFYQKNCRIPCTLSVTSSFMDFFPKVENNLKDDKDDILIKFKRNSSHDNVINWRLSNSFMYLKDIPSWSQKMILSHKETSLSSSSSGQLSILSTQKLLEEINAYIYTVIKCDGAIVHCMDDAHQIIDLSDLERGNIPNIKRGTTLADYVVSQRVGVNVPDVFKDDRFPQGILCKTTNVKAAMAQPIIMNNGELVGVIEVYRLSDKVPFSREEEEIFVNYCAWGSIGIFYNEIYLQNRKQQNLNKFLLEVTQKMFGKIHTIDGIIKDIMANAKSLVLADRVSLFLLDGNVGLYSQIFDKGNYKECIFEVKPDLIRFKIGEGIAGHVAATGETLNIHDAYNDPRFNRSIDVLTGYVTKTILCMPVKLNDVIIGVVQMLNKKNGYFTSIDESDFQTFATYCGVALHIAKMYEKILKSHQKYKVALDVLSYHSGYTEEEFQELKSKSFPTNKTDLAKFSFWPWTVPNEDNAIYVIFMFKDLFDFELFKIIADDISGFNIEFKSFDQETIMRFILTVKKNYRSVPYHNWSHAFSVAHSMYVLLKICHHKFDLYESLALFIACICHDLDHRGKTNQYMVQNSSPLSALYSTSTMEHHHFNMTVTILQRDGHNIFKHLSSVNYRKVLGHIKHCILATDLAKYFEYKQLMISDKKYFNAKHESNRLIHMALSMTLCDLCSMYKDWDMQLSLVMIIMKEFWTQGDEERTKGRTPMKMLDRDYKLDLPDCQVGFIKDICLPCFQLVEKMNPEISCVTQSAERNLIVWQQLAALPKTEKMKKINELELFVEEFIISNKLNFK